MEGLSIADCGRRPRGCVHPLPAGKILPHLPEDAGSILSFHAYLRENGHERFHGENSQMTVGLLTRLEQEMLELPAASTGLVFSSKTVEDGSGAILEVYRTVYRADRFIFVYS